MEPTGQVRFRRRAAADMADAYAVFRRSLFDYLHRIGAVDSPVIDQAQIEQAWTKQQAWMEHLAATAAEDWVAEDSGGRIVGWAQSIERDGLLELTLFFVEPTIQSRGVGRGLLERAFPLGRGRSRSINATQDPRAVGLYLHSGVRFMTTTALVRGQPTRSAVTTDLAIERALPSDRAAAEADIAEIEREVLGHMRVEDTRYLLDDRPAWLARRGGRVVGMAFGISSQKPASGGGHPTGPIGALDPADLPALLGTVENDAVASGIELLAFVIPMVNSTALGYLLGRHYQIDLFYTFVLGSDDRMRLDRWVQTNPEFII